MKTVKSIVESDNNFVVTFEDDTNATYPSGLYLFINRRCLNGTVSVECLTVGDIVINEAVEGRQP